MTPVRSKSIGTQQVYRARRAVHTHIFLQQSIVQSLRVKFIHRTIAKSQQSHCEFQAVKTEVEHTI